MSPLRRGVRGGLWFGPAGTTPVLGDAVAFLSLRQLQQQQAELEVHQRDGLSSYDLSQVSSPEIPSGRNCLQPKEPGTAFDP